MEQTGYPKKLKGIDYIDFDLDASITQQEGRLFWNADDNTLEVGMTGGDVNLQIGQEILIRATNDDVNITNGQAVYISGATGNNPNVKIADTSSTDSCKTIAISTENVLASQKGYFTTFGLVRDVNTLGMTVGNELWLSTSGSLTTTRPTFPNCPIKIGYVVRVHATEGIIFVNIDNQKWRMPLESSKDTTGFDASDSTLKGSISFGGTRTFTIQPQAGKSYFNFWHRGTEFRKTTAVTKQITDVTGIHVIYFDETGTIQESVNPTVGTVGQVIRGYTIVSIIYWNATDAEAIYVGDERHLNQMDGNTHAYLHYTNGLAYVSGLGLNSFSVDGTGAVADVQFGVDEGRTADEDIDFPSDAIVSTTGLPIYHQTSTGWHRTVKAGYSARTSGGTSATNIAYNQYTGGAWKLTAVQDAKFCLYHVFATTEKDKPIISIMGQAQYETVSAARAGAKTEVQSLVLDNILFPEVRVIGTIIYQANTTYANDINARIRSTDEGDNYVDWRSETVSRVALSTSDHGTLTGLTDSGDHPYALLVDGTRDLTGSQNTQTLLPVTDSLYDLGSSSKYFANAYADILNLSYAAGVTKLYDFNNITSPSSYHKSYYNFNASLDTLKGNPVTGWGGTEITTAEYGQLWLNDGDVLQYLKNPAETNYIAQMYEFTIGEASTVISNLNLYAKCYALKKVGSPVSGLNYSIFIWNSNTASWEDLSGTLNESVPTAHTYNKNSNLSYYVTAGKKVYVLIATIVINAGAGDWVLIRDDYISLTTTLIAGKTTYSENIINNDLTVKKTSPYAFNIQNDAGTQLFNVNTTTGASSFETVAVSKDIATLGQVWFKKGSMALGSENGTITFITVDPATTENAILNMGKTFTDGTLPMSGINLAVISKPGVSTTSAATGISINMSAETSNYGVGAELVGIDVTLCGDYNYGVGSANLNGYGVRVNGNYDLAGMTYNNLFAGWFKVSNYLIGLPTIPNAYGIYIATGNGNTGTQYGLYLEKTAGGTVANYQVMLAGNGTGTGIWFDSAERIYSDGTNFCSAAPVKFVGGTVSSDGSAGITATITTAPLTSGGSTGSMTFKNGILTAQTQST
jgi:hypothetical protein